MCREGLGFLSSNICVAENAVKKLNSKASTEPLSTANNHRLDSALPSTRPGAMPLNKSQRTAPAWWCARVLASEVMTMVDMPVAIAIFTDMSVGISSWCNKKVRKGIMTNAPPTPSSPARKPANEPSTASASNNSGQLVISVMPNRVFAPCLCVAICQWRLWGFLPATKFCAVL